MIKDDRVYVGIDVQVQRPCAMVALDHDLRMIDSVWLEGASFSETLENLCGRLARWGVGDRVTIGIDAPRQPLREKRSFYWDRKTTSWRARRSSERGWGRHCDC